jgi:hypothetical protein
MFIVNCIKCVASIVRMIVDYQLGRMWKDMAIAYLKVLSEKLSAGTGE